MVKIGQVYKCRFSKKFAFPFDKDFYVLVSMVGQKNEVALVIIKDKEEWVGKTADGFITVKDIDHISEIEESQLFDMFDYEFCSSYQVNFRSPI